MLPCQQEPTINRIESKIDQLDSKVDKFLERTTKLETKVGFVTTAIVVFVLPAAILVLKFFIDN